MWLSTPPTVQRLEQIRADFLPVPIESEHPIPQFVGSPNAPADARREGHLGTVLLDQQSAHIQKMTFANLP
jgi:hypothetical protein